MGSEMPHWYDRYPERLLAEHQTIHDLHGFGFVSRAEPLPDGRMAVQMDRTAGGRKWSFLVVYDESDSHAHVSLHAYATSPDQSQLIARLREEGKDVDTLFCVPKDESELPYLNLVPYYPSGCPTVDGWGVCSLHECFVGIDHWIADYGKAVGNG